MKKIFLVIALITFFASCKKKEIITEPVPKSYNGYFISGNVISTDEIEVYLQKQLTDKSFETIKTTHTVNKQFLFSDKIENSRLYYIGFNNSPNKIPVIANNFETYITVNDKDVSKSKILGSPLQDKYTKYLTGLDSVKNKFVYKLEYIKTNSNSVLATFVLKQMLGKTKWRLGQNRKAYEYLSSDIKSSSIGKEISAYLSNNEPLVEKQEDVAEVSLDPKISNEVPVEIIKKKTQAVILPTRRKAPNFYAESINGNDISLSSATKNAKVTLIDFWASWCAPCRAQNPHLVRLYNKYHSKGFNVIGVSEDKYVDINNWKNAIATDGLPWKQVIDDNNRVANMFGVKGIPHTVLLDQNGGIIFAKKSGYTIEQKLKEIFGF